MFIWALDKNDAIIAITELLMNYTAGQMLNKRHLQLTSGCILMLFFHISSNFHDADFQYFWLVKNKKMLMGNGLYGGSKLFMFFAPIFPL